MILIIIGRAMLMSVPGAVAPWGASQLAINFGRPTRTQALPHLVLTSVVSFGARHVIMLLGVRYANDNRLYFGTGQAQRGNAKDQAFGSRSIRKFSRTQLATGDARDLPSGLR